MSNLFLMRYDVEHDDVEKMKGYFEKVIEVHRKDQIPASFFCTGNALDKRESAFRAFYQEVKNDPLFDLQDHSYTHIGICYEAGKPVPVLHADYEQSFAAHKRVLGKDPVGVSICGTSGKDGKSLSGFDATDKAKEELAMLVGLGLKMINTRLSHRQGNHEFCNYSSLGFPEVMGYPSTYSDTEWMAKPTTDPAEEAVFGYIKNHAEKGWHMPLIMHDWCSWLRSPDQELTHVRRIAEKARKEGFELVTHWSCYDRKELWTKHV